MRVELSIKDTHAYLTSLCSMSQRRKVSIEFCLYGIY